MWPLCNSQSAISLELEFDLNLIYMKKFCSIFREKLWSHFWISLHILYIQTSPAAQNREKSSSTIFFDVNDNEFHPGCLGISSSINESVRSLFAILAEIDKF